MKPTQVVLVKKMFTGREKETGHICSQENPIVVFLSSVTQIAPVFYIKLKSALRRNPKRNN